jgi:hypothetical protein
MGMDGNRGAEVAVAGVGVTVMDVIGTLAAVRPAAASAGLIDQLRELEDLKSATAALQARIAVAFDLLQRQEQAATGTPASELGAGVAAQVALARRESRHVAAGYWVWPRPWSRKCPTLWRPWRPVT